MPLLTTRIQLTEHLTLITIDIQEEGLFMVWLFDKENDTRTVLAQGETYQQALLNTWEVITKMGMHINEQMERLKNRKEN